MLTQYQLSAGIYLDHTNVKSHIREGYSGEWEKQNLREERETGEGPSDFVIRIIRCLCPIGSKTWLLNECKSYWTLYQLVNYINKKSIWIDAEKPLDKIQLH